MLLETLVVTSLIMLKLQPVPLENGGHSVGKRLRYSLPLTWLHNSYLVED